MIDRHEHLDEGTIHAWLDGALPPDKSARVEAEASSCSDCSALVAEARGLIAASSRILSSLDTVPAGVIPGSSGNIDQLAAVRARRAAHKRAWWNDRRILGAAASIVFVAGVSTMVWRSAPESAKMVRAPEADATAPMTDSAPPVEAPAPAPDAASLAREAPSPSMNELSAPKAPPAPVAVTVDTGAERKVAATGSAAANEARVAESTLQDRARQAESRREQARADQVAPAQQQLRQQAASTTQLQGFQQLRPDTMRVTTPPATFGQRALRAPAVAGAAADRAAPSCFRLQAASPLPDSVRLFDDILPLETDPSWFRADYVGRTRPAVDLRWRQVDSVTIELRFRSADSSGVRFKVDSTSADVRNAPGVRAVIANRIACPVLD